MYGYGSEITPLENAILTVFAIVIIIIFGGAIYAFVMAIFQFVFSKGDAEKVKKAWNNIRYMILGIIFSVFLLFIFPMVMEKMQIPGYDVYTANNIFGKATELIKTVFSVGNNEPKTYNAPANEGGSTNGSFQL